MNLEKGLPHLLSWENGFALGQVTKLTPCSLQLTLRPLPAKVAGRRWAVWCHRLIGNEQAKVEFVWCLELPMRAEVAARVILAEIRAHLEHKRTAASTNVKSPTQLSLTESQLQFLAKSYPRTVALFRAAGLQPTAEEKRRLHDELARTFVEETYACSKVVLEPVTDGEQLFRMAKLFEKMTARQYKSDRVDYELIVGCYPKGYCSMKWRDVQKAVASAVGSEPTVEALRKKWTRLKLPSRRRRGRPGKDLQIRTQ